MEAALKSIEELNEDPHTKTLVGMNMLFCLFIIF
jgi:hypothetical protein